MRFIMRAFLTAMLLTVSLDKTKAEVVFTNLGLDDSFDVFSYGFGRVPGKACVRTRGRVRGHVTSSAKIRASTKRARSVSRGELVRIRSMSDCRGTHGSIATIRRPRQSIL
jgi:hypothetical protein